MGALSSLNLLSHSQFYCSKLPPSHYRSSNCYILYTEKRRRGVPAFLSLLSASKAVCCGVMMMMVVAVVSMVVRREKRQPYFFPGLQLLDWKHLSLKSHSKQWKKNWNSLSICFSSTKQSFLLFQSATLISCSTVKLQLANKKKVLLYLSQNRNSSWVGMIFCRSLY